MVSNLVIGSFGVNIVVALAIVIACVLRYRKTQGFIQSLLWGVGISLITNLITNLVGVTLFPEGYGNTHWILASFINALIMTLGLGVAYIVTSKFQFEKGIKPKVGVINALGFSLMPLFNLILQSVNFILYSAAINAGTAEQFITETFDAAKLAELTKLLSTISVAGVVELSVARIIDFVVVVIFFSLIVKSVGEDRRINVKKIMPILGMLLVYYFVITLSTFFIQDYTTLVVLSRFVVAVGLFAYFSKKIDL